MGPSATLSDLELIKNSGISIQDLDKDTPKRRKIRMLFKKNFFNNIEKFF